MENELISGLAKLNQLKREERSTAKRIVFDSTSQPLLFFGCYLDASAGVQTSSTQMSNEYCATYCRDAGTAFASTTGITCVCHNFLPSGPIHPLYCNQICPVVEASVSDNLGCSGTSCCGRTFGYTAYSVFSVGDVPVEKVILSNVAMNVNNPYGGLDLPEGVLTENAGVCDFMIGAFFQNNGWEFCTIDIDICVNNANYENFQCSPTQSDPTDMDPQISLYYEDLIVSNELSQVSAAQSLSSYNIELDNTQSSVSQTYSKTYSVDITNSKEWSIESGVSTSVQASLDTTLTAGANVFGVDVSASVSLGLSVTTETDFSYGNTWTEDTTTTESITITINGRPGYVTTATLTQVEEQQIQRWQAYITSSGYIQFFLANGIPASITGDSIQPLSRYVRDFGNSGRFFATGTKTSTTQNFYVATVVDETPSIECQNCNVTSTDFPSNQLVVYYPCDEYAFKMISATNEDIDLYGIVGGNPFSSITAGIIGNSKNFLTFQNQLSNSNNPLAGASSGGISYWFQLTRYSVPSDGYYPGVIDTGYMASYLCGTACGLDANKIKVIAFYRNTSGEVVEVGFKAPTSILNRWNHVVFSFDASLGTFNAWINNVQFGSAIVTLGSYLVTPTGASSPIVISRSDGGGYYTYSNFIGQIDEVGIWSRALTESDVSILYNNGMGTIYPAVRDNYGTMLNIYP
jgi:hypothetical protein